MLGLRSAARHTRYVALASVVGAVAAISSAPARAERLSAPARFLQEEMKLVSVKRGQTWIAPLEVSLRQRLEQMQRLHGQIEFQRRKLEERIERNQRFWVSQRGMLESLRSAAAGLSRSDPQRQTLEDSIRQLTKRAVDPRQLSAVPDVQARLIDLIKDRNNLSVSYFWMQRSLPLLRDQYRTLERDPRVQRALEELGKKHQLGPEREYEKTLSKYRPVVFARQVPLYRRSNRWRFCVLVNDQTPLTCSWSEAGGPTLLTSSMVERLGMEISESATEVVHHVGRRKFVTRRILIPTVRLGKLRWHDVEAYVLPPEGEDLGAVFGPAAFRGARIELEPSRLRMVLGDASPANARGDSP